MIPQEERPWIDASLGLPLTQSWQKLPWVWDVLGTPEHGGKEGAAGMGSPGSLSSSPKLMCPLHEISLQSL